MNHLISILLMVLLPAGLALVALPWVLLVRSEPFPAAAMVAALCSIAALEKIWSSFFKMRQRVKTEAKQDWTTVSVGYSFTAVWYVGLFDIFLRLRENAAVPVIVAGTAIYAIAVLLRYWILHHLGHQWTVHVDEELPDRQLVRTGPYRFVRHPLYAEAFLEVIGIALLAGSLPALLVALLVFIPLEMHRAYFEERYLKQIFGDEYADYKRETWAFFPLPFGKK